MSLATKTTVLWVFEAHVVSILRAVVCRFRNDFVHNVSKRAEKVSADTNIDP